MWLGYMIKYFGFVLSGHLSSSFDINTVKNNAVTVLIHQSSIASGGILHIMRYYRVI